MPILNIVTPMITLGFLPAGEKLRSRGHREFTLVTFVFPQTKQYEKRSSHKLSQD